MSTRTDRSSQTPAGRITIERLAGPGVVRATMPIQPRAFARKSCPFVLHDPLGGLDYATQWECVTRTADGKAAVVELIGYVDDDTTGPSLEVYLDRAPVETERPGPEVQDLLLGRFGDPALRLTMAGYGAQLALDLQDRAEGDRLRWHRRGPVMSTAELAGRLWTPEGLPGPGYQAWLTFRRGEDVLLVDLVLHNASAEQPLGDLEFEDLLLHVPEGWAVEHMWPEPASGGPLMGAPGQTIWPLIAQAGGPHAMIQRQRREYRFALYPTGAHQRALELLDGDGWGVCTDQWRERGAWGPQRLPVPDLGHLSTGYLRGIKNALWSALASGAPVGAGNTTRRAVGPYHPWGVHHGGMTGGSEIDQWEPVGLETLQTGDPDGLLYLRARHRCLTDRHHVGLYGPDGRPVRGDDWAKATGAADWSLGSDGRFQAGKEPFGLAAAQNATPAPDCPYLTELQRWNPIDWQHLVRRVGTSISLAWLDHDPIARRELMLAAELGRMAMWEGPGGSLAGDLGFVSAHSGKGCAWGRGQGWILHTAAAAAQLNGPARLQRWGAWFEGVGTVADTGVTPTGCLQGNGFGKPAHGAPFLDRYRVTQSFEHAILANGLYGVAQTVYDAPGLMAAVLSMARQGVCEFLWWDGSNSTYKITAIGPNDISLPVFTLTDPRINDGFKDGWQVASALAFSLDADRTHALTEKRVKDYCNGASDPLKYLLGRNRENLGNRAPLIAVLQR